MRPNQFFVNGMISTNGPFHVEPTVEPVEKNESWASTIFAALVLAVALGVAVGVLGILLNPLYAG